MSSTEQKTDRTHNPSLESLEKELKKQSRSIRRTQQGFALFAAAALVIALVNLVTTAAKLGTKDVRVTRGSVAAKAAPAAPAQKGAAATPTPPPHSLNVSLKEFKVLPAVAKAAAGKVTFHVRNIGTVKHEFVVIKTNKPAADLLKGSAASEKGKVGEIDGLNPGKSGNLALHLKPGHYALICNQPGHYKLGQHVDFTVG